MLLGLCVSSLCRGFICKALASHSPCCRDSTDVEQKLRRFASEHPFAGEIGVAEKTLLNHIHAPMPLQGPIDH